MSKKGRTRSIRRWVMAGAFLLGTLLVLLLFWSETLMQRHIASDGVHLFSLERFQQAPRYTFLEMPSLLRAPQAGEERRSPAFDPLTGDLFLARRLPGQHFELVRARKPGKGELAPLERIFELNSAADDLDPHVTERGQALLFCSNRPGGAGGFDIYRARRQGTSFGPPKPLLALNSEGDERHPATDRTGARLVFASNRLDQDLQRFALFESVRAGKRFARPARILFPRTNDTFEALSPALSPDGRLLFFASNRPGGKGGLDLYRSLFFKQRWRTPEPVSSVNSPQDEQDPAFGREGAWLAFSRTASDGSSPTIHLAARRELLALAEVGPSLTWLLSLLAGLLLLLGLTSLVLYWRDLHPFVKFLILSAMLHLAVLLFVSSRKARLQPLEQESEEALNISFLPASAGAHAGSAARAQGDRLAPVPVMVPIKAARSRLPPRGAPEPRLSPAPKNLLARSFPRESEQVLETPLVATRKHHLARIEELPRASRSAAARVQSGPEEVAAAVPRAQPLAAPDQHLGQHQQSRKAQSHPVEAPPAKTPPVVATTPRPLQPAPDPASLLPLVQNSKPMGSAPAARETRLATPSLAARPLPREQAPLSARPEARSLARAPRGAWQPAGEKPLARTGNAEVAPEPPRDFQVAVPERSPKAGAGRAPPRQSPLLAARQSPASQPQDPLAPFKANSRSLRSKLASRHFAKLLTTPRPMGHLNHRPDLGSNLAAHRPLSRGALAEALKPPGLALDARSLVSASTPRESQRLSLVPTQTLAALRAPPLFQVSAARPVPGTRSGDPTPASPLAAAQRFQTAPPPAPARSPQQASPRTRFKAPRLPRPALAMAPRRAPSANANQLPLPPLYAQRRGAAHVPALLKAGGDARTEAAVLAGLRYLKSRQRKSGAFGRHSFDRKYGDVRVGKTGLALLAFLGSGYTHKRAGSFKLTVARGLAFLQREQDARSGHFGQTAAYSHGIATYALAEAFAMTRDQSLKPSLQHAVRRILHAQIKSRDLRLDGGWSYFYPDEARRFDPWPRLSVSVWQIMALESARMSGLPGLKRPLLRARSFVLKCFDPRLQAFRYNHDPEWLRSDFPTLPGSNAAALFALELLGVPRQDARYQTVLQYVLERPPTWPWRRPALDAFVKRGAGNGYFLYYATLALRLHGGQAWERWNRALKALLLAAQAPDGSFKPISRYMQYVGDTERDRSYTTALCVLMLEVYYRYDTPLLRALSSDLMLPEHPQQPAGQPLETIRSKSGR